MSHYLVTGGAGFIGSHLTAALLRRGDRVTVLDDFSTGRRENLEGLESSARRSGLELVQGDVADLEACRTACRGADAVFHQAAQVSVVKSIQEPERSYDVNVMGSLRLLEAAREHRVPRFVFASSSAVYGDSEVLPKTESMPERPLSPYASGKLAAEHLMSVYGSVHGIRTVSLRYFNVFGPRQLDDSPYTGVIAIFVRALLDGQAPIIYGDGEQTRDFTYVDNVVQANLKALEHDLEPGTAVNVGCGERVSVNDLYAAIGRELAIAREPAHAPPRAGDVRHSLASLDRAKHLLDYAPTVAWRDGLAKTVAWYCERWTRSVR